jgi:flagellar L-ring protein precursor FlgH
MRKWLIFLAALALAIMLPYSIKAQDALRIGAPSLYTDLKAHRVGDLLTIMIFEDASAENETNTETKKDAQYDVSGGPGIGPLDFIPHFGVSGSGISDHRGEGSTDCATTTRARMTARVTAITANGDLLIEGRRVIGVNDDKEALTLTGVVRATDVGADNTVPSHVIADAQIIYNGRGPAGPGARPGLLVRVINWLFQEKRI